MSGIGEVLHVDPQASRHLEVLLLQFFLALLHALDEGLFLLGKLHVAGFLDDSIIMVLPVLILLRWVFVPRQVAVEFPHQRVIPGCGAIDASDVGILEGETPLGCGRITQCAHVGQREATHVHVVIDTVDEFLYINLSDRYRYNILFLVAGAYQCYHASRR